MLERLIYGHNHKWAIVKEKPVVERGSGSSGRTYFTLQCEICGRLQSHRVD